MPGRAEQPQHRQIDLAVSAVRRRIDQPRAAVTAPEDVPAPEVAVQPGGRLGRAGELGHPRAHALDGAVAEARQAGVRRAAAAAAARRRRSASPAWSRWEARASRGEAGPDRRATSRPWAGRRTSSAPAAWISASPAPNAAGSPRPPSSTQSSTSTSSATPSTSGTRSAPGSPSQRNPAASAAYSPASTPSRVLTNPNDSSVELHSVRLVDVAAADALDAAHVPAGGRAHRRLEAHRSESSRPRQAASTWSSTFSKPSGPP